MIRSAVTCDQDNCQAFLLGPAAGDPSATVEDFAAESGWTRGDRGYVCPACEKGDGPVHERGECLRCGGRIVDRREGEICLYCGELTPENGDEW